VPLDLFENCIASDAFPELSILWMSIQSVFYPVMPSLFREKADAESITDAAGRNKRQKPPKPKKHAFLVFPVF